MEKSIDLRVLRTDKMIKAAFYELMDTIGFEKITVQNLTKKANINRTTFYLHYMDKYDLLGKIEDEILEGLKQLITNLPVNEVLQNGFLNEKPFMALHSVYSYIEENHTFFTLIMGKNGDPSFVNKLGETLKLAVFNDEMVKRLKVPENYAKAMMITVHTSFINEWLRNGMVETPLEMTSMIVQIIKGIPENIYK